MSASTEKKNRQAARQAGNDKKAIAAKEAAAKQKKSKIKWTVGTVAVVVVIALVLFLDSGFLYTHPTALSVKDEDYNAAEVNYFYGSNYRNFINQYGDYATLFGLDPRSGITGLASQPCPMLGDDASWRDYFLQAAENQLLQNQAINAYAAENGISLTDEEAAEINDSFEGMEEIVKLQGFNSVDKFFAANYGTGVDTEIVRLSNLSSALAAKTYQQVNTALEYTDEELESYYAGLNGESDVFDYAVYTVSAEAVESTNEAGEAVSAPTDETRAAAAEKAEAVLAVYNGEAPEEKAEEAEEAPAEEAETEESAEETEESAEETEESAEETEEAAEEPAEEAEPAELSEADELAAKLSAAAAAQTEGAAAERRKNSGAAGMAPEYKEWLMGQREMGDITLAASEDGNTQYIVLFLGRSDNHYPVAQVRHILVRAAAAEDGSYTEEAKAAAKEKAESILNEWEMGDKTEDSFAELANLYSEDPGSNTSGGLYDQVVKGQMVEEFDRFCFEGHEHGDVAIVYGESGGVPGYHVMFYVGEGELYSSIIADNGLRTEAMDKWLAEVTEGYAAEEHYAIRFVG